MQISLIWFENYPLFLDEVIHNLSNSWWLSCIRSNGSIASSVDVQFCWWLRVAMADKPASDWLLRALMEIQCNWYSRSYVTSFCKLQLLIQIRILDWLWIIQSHLLDKNFSFSMEVFEGGWHKYPNGLPTCPLHNQTFGETLPCPILGIDCLPCSAPCLIDVHKFRVSDEWSVT